MVTICRMPLKFLPFAGCSDVQGLSWIGFWGFTIRCFRIGRGIHGVLLGSALIYFDSEQEQLMRASHLAHLGQKNPWGINWGHPTTKGTKGTKGT